MEGIKMNDTVWVISNEKPHQVICKFIGNREIAFELDGKLESRHFKDVFPTKKAAQQYIDAQGYLAFCREISKDTGEVSVYPIKTIVDSALIQALKIRGRFNPELQYAVTTKEFFNEHHEEMMDYEYFERVAEQNFIIRM